MARSVLVPCPVMSSRPTLAELGDGWYESEERTRSAMVTELRRARRRFGAHPVRVLLLAALLTGAVMYKVTHKQREYPAEVILALTEGTLSPQRHGVPADQLRHYVTSVLMSEKNLLEVIERHNLIPLRKKLGPQFAVEELWSQMEVEIWKNSFIYHHAWDANARKSVRIGITYRDSDPDRAYTVAQDIARVVIAQHDLDRQKLMDAVSNEVRSAREHIERRLRDLTTATAIKQTAMAEAHKAKKQGLVAALHVDLAAIDSEAKKLEDQLQLILQSPEELAGQVARAGLDVTLSVAEERRPDRREASTFALVFVGVVVALGSLLISALILGAFDSRIHDTDDVERLGLAVLGHVPGFAGDDVGSLRARGVARPSPSVMRWLHLR